MYTNKDKQIYKFSVIKWLLVIFLLYVAVHSFLTAWAGSLTGLYAPIKVIQDVIVALILIPTAVYIVRNKQVHDWVIQDLLSWIIIAYGSMHLALLFLFDLIGSKAAIAGIIFNLRFLVIFLCIRILLYGRPALKKAIFLPASKAIVVIGTIVALLAIVQVTIMPRDFLVSFGYDGVMAPAPVSTVDSRADTLRAFGTLQGPNELGAYLILPLCIAFGTFVKNRRIIYGMSAMIMGAALVLTHSRSAMLAGLVALFIMLLSEYRQHLTGRRLGVGLLALCLFAIGTLLGAEVSPQIRVFVFHSSSDDSSLIEGSTGDHLTATLAGIRDVLSNPLGYGPGGAGPAAFYTVNEKPRIAENYFVQIAQEVGILGMTLFLVICVLIVRRLMHLKQDNFITSLIASFIGISVTCLFLHTWTDEAVAYTWWIFAAIALSSESRLGIIKSNKKDEE